jgi:hypothetical protein
MHVGVAWNFLFLAYVRFCDVGLLFVCLKLKFLGLALDVYSRFCYLKFLGLVVDGESQYGLWHFCLYVHHSTQRIRCINSASILIFCGIA